MRNIGQTKIVQMVLVIIWPHYTRTNRSEEQSYLERDLLRRDLDLRRDRDLERRLRERDLERLILLLFSKSTTENP